MTVINYCCNILLERLARFADYQFSVLTVVEPQLANAYCIVSPDEMVRKEYPAVTVIYDITTINFYRPFLFLSFM